MKTSKNNLLKNLMLLLFPLRDSLGIMIAATPLRFGEIFNVVFFITSAKKTRVIVNKKELCLVLILVVNLFLSIIGCLLFLSSIDQIYATKYLLRNILSIMLFVAFLFSSITFTEKDIERMMNIMMFSQVVILISLYGFDTYLYISEFRGMDNIMANGQYLSIAGVLIPRFMGTCSEAGYLTPFLAGLVFYYLDGYMRKCGKYQFRLLMLSIVMTLLTFSTSVYIFVVITIVFVFIKNRKFVRWTKIFLQGVLGALAFSSCVLLIPALRTAFMNAVALKIYSYLFGTSTLVSLSASDRSQQLKSVWNFFCDGNALQLFIGQGTGAYAKYAQAMHSQAMLLTAAEEAYNLYLSTLADRGILGLLIIVAMFFTSYHMRVKNNRYSDTLFWIIVAQALHWMLTGNFWLYFFWYALVIQMGFKRYVKSKEGMKCG